MTCQLVNFIFVGMGIDRRSITPSDLDRRNSKGSGSPKAAKG